MTDLEQLEKIEYITGKKLYECPADKNIMEWDAKCIYCLTDKQVTSLNLRGCEIINIDFLLNLKNLIHLDLSDNKISEINTLEELNKLTRLDISSNKIKKIDVLSKLKKLTKLDFSSNEISNISSVKGLENITELYLRNNKVSDISSLEGLKKLTMLNLSNNLLTKISELKNLKKLVQLDLSHNQLKVLPEWLLDFNLGIKWKGDFSEYGVNLENNPLELPPPEVIKRGNKAIRKYFAQLKKQGTDYLYEAKLILIGEGGSGKTSLANKIINPHYILLPEIESESTQGIDILKYRFPYKNKSFNVNIWDFGGQEIYHQTHQFFLSKRSLYFIVADNRKEDTDFYYWLNTVEMLSDRSPLLIIKNEKRNRVRQIPEKQLKAEFNNIEKILSTNLSDNRGLDVIIKNLQHFITQLPHIGTPLPKAWVKVRQQLEQDSRYYIELKEYFSLCQEYGFEKEADKLQLSGYLHDLGVCLHFQEDEFLYKTLILKPTWATDAVYKVLDNREVITNFGRFNKEDLKKIWQDEQYSSMRGELLALMLNFKLCFEIPNKTKNYIAPQLLENDALIYVWKSENNLLLRYHYEFMPKGLLSQLIVVMHEYIAHDYQWVWKSGVVLEKDQTQAEIIEYYGKREIHIRVEGQQKKELLSIVSYELDKINNSYERLRDKCKKLIPCHCEKCKQLENPHFYDYKKLKQRIADQKYTIECDNRPYLEVNILKLVDDVYFNEFSKNLAIQPFNSETPLTTTINNPNSVIVQQHGDVIMTNKKNSIYAEKNAQVQQFNESNNNTSTQNQNKPPKEKINSLLKKPLFYVIITSFIYFLMVSIVSYDLQKEGKLGNKTFKDIVLSPISLLKSDSKK